MIMWSTCVGVCNRLISFAGGECLPLYLPLPAPVEHIVCHIFIDDKGNGTGRRDTQQVGHYALVVTRNPFIAKIRLW